MPASSLPPPWVATSAGADLPPSEALVRAARRSGGHVWLERRLFEVVGGWVRAEVDLDAKLLFARQAQHHAWRAAGWEERLPELREMPRASFVRPASGALVELCDALASARSTLERLVGGIRVALPASIDAVEAHRARTSPVADGPVQRWIALALHDASADLDSGRRLLATKLIGDADLAEASEHERRYVALLPGEG